MFLILENILLFFKNPHKNFLYLHIAGTKGKTSVAYYSYQLLLSIGKTAGLFVSPHVYDYKERIQCNGAFISENDYLRIKKKVDEAEKLLEITLNFFEHYLVVAFLYFTEKKPEYIVLEVGIGGLLDSTNIISPTISIISSIQKDHQSMLGSSLWRNVYHKLGIIKPKIPFIIGKQSFLATIYIWLQTYLKKCNRKKILPYKLKKTERDIHTIIINNRLITLKGPYYMIDNFILALSALNQLNLLLKQDSLVFTHSIPGRFEQLLLKSDRKLILDGAHNVIAFKAFKRSLKSYFNENQYVMVVIIKKDKNIKSIVKQIKSIAKMVIVPSFYKEFGDVFDPTDFINFLKKKRVPTMVLNKEELVLYLNSQRLILFTGSFYHLGFAKNSLK